MSGIIPEDDEEQEMYDDVGTIAQPIDEDIYEELPGLTMCYMTMITSIMLEKGTKCVDLVWFDLILFFIYRFVSPEEEVPAVAKPRPPKIEPASKPVPPPAAGTQSTDICAYLNPMWYI